MRSLPAQETKKAPEEQVSQLEGLVPALSQAGEQATQAALEKTRELEKLAVQVQELGTSAEQEASAQTQELESMQREAVANRYSQAGELFLQYEDPKVQEAGKLILGEVEKFRAGNREALEKMQKLDLYVGAIALTTSPKLKLSKDATNIRELAGLTPSQAIGETKKSKKILLGAQIELQIINLEQTAQDAQKMGERYGGGILASSSANLEKIVKESKKLKKQILEETNADAQQKLIGQFNGKLLYAQSTFKAAAVYQVNLERVEKIDGQIEVCEKAAKDTEARIEGAETAEEKKAYESSAQIYRDKITVLEGARATILGAGAEIESALEAQEDYGKALGNARSMLAYSGFLEQEGMSPKPGEEVVSAAGELKENPALLLDAANREHFASLRIASAVASAANAQISASNELIGRIDASQDLTKAQKKEARSWVSRGIELCTQAHEAANKEGVSGEELEAARNKIILARLQMEGAAQTIESSKTLGLEKARDLAKKQAAARKRGGPVSRRLKKWDTEGEATEKTPKEQLAYLEETVNRAMELKAQAYEAAQSALTAKDEAAAEELTYKSQLLFARSNLLISELATYTQALEQLESAKKSFRGNGLSPAENSRMERAEQKAADQKAKLAHIEELRANLRRVENGLGRLAGTDELGEAEISAALSTISTAAENLEKLEVEQNISDYEYRIRGFAPNKKYTETLWGAAVGAREILNGEGKWKEVGFGARKAAAAQQLLVANTYATQFTRSGWANCELRADGSRSKHKTLPEIEAEVKARSGRKLLPSELARRYTGRALAAMVSGEETPSIQTDFEKGADYSKKAKDGYSRIAQMNMAAAASRERIAAMGGAVEEERGGAGAVRKSGAQKAKEEMGIAKVAERSKDYEKSVWAYEMGEATSKQLANAGGNLEGALALAENNREGSVRLASAREKNAELNYQIDKLDGEAAKQDYIIARAEAALAGEFGEAQTPKEQEELLSRIGPEKRERISILRTQIAQANATKEQIGTRISQLESEQTELGSALGQTEVAKNIQKRREHEHKRAELEKEKLILETEEEEAIKNAQETDTAAATATGAYDDSTERTVRAAYARKRAELEKKIEDNEVQIASLPENFDFRNVDPEKFKQVETAVADAHYALQEVDNELPNFDLAAECGSAVVSIMENNQAVRHSTPGILRSGDVMRETREGAESKTAEEYQKAAHLAVFGGRRFMGDESVSSRLAGVEGTYGSAQERRSKAVVQKREANKESQQVASLTAARTSDAKYEDFDSEAGALDEVDRVIASAPVRPSLGASQDELVAYEEASRKYAQERQKGQQLTDAIAIARSSSASAGTHIAASGSMEAHVEASNDTLHELLASAEGLSGEQIAARSAKLEEYAGVVLDINELAQWGELGTLGIELFTPVGGALIVAKMIGGGMEMMADTGTISPALAAELALMESGKLGKFMKVYRTAELIKYARAAIPKMRTVGQKTKAALSLARPLAFNAAQTGTLVYFTGSAAMGVAHGLEEYNQTGRGMSHVITQGIFTLLPTKGVVQGKYHAWKTRRTSRKYAELTRREYQSRGEESAAQRADSSFLEMERSFEAAEPASPRLEQNLEALGISKGTRTASEAAIGAAALEARTNALRRTFRGIEGVGAQVIEAEPGLLTQPQAEFEANIHRFRDTRKIILRLEKSAKKHGREVKGELEKDPSAYLNKEFRADLQEGYFAAKAEQMGVTNLPSSKPVEAPAPKKLTGAEKEARKAASKKRAAELLKERVAGKKLLRGEEVIRRIEKETQEAIETPDLTPRDYMELAQSRFRESTEARKSAEVLRKDARRTEIDMGKETVSVQEARGKAAELERRADALGDAGRELQREAIVVTQAQEHMHVEANYPSREVGGISSIGRGEYRVDFNSAESARAEKILLAARDVIGKKTSLEGVPAEIRSEVQTLARSAAFRDAVYSNSGRYQLYLSLAEVAKPAEIVRSLRRDIVSLRAKAAVEGESVAGEKAAARAGELEVVANEIESRIPAQEAPLPAAELPRGLEYTAKIKPAAEPGFIEAKTVAIRGEREMLPKTLAELENLPPGTRVKIEIQGEGEAAPEVWTLRYEGTQGTGAMKSYAYTYESVPYAGKAHSTGYLRFSEAARLKNALGREPTPLEMIARNISKARRDLKGAETKGGERLVEGEEALAGFDLDAEAPIIREGIGRERFLEEYYVPKAEAEVALDLLRTTPPEAARTRRSRPVTETKVGERAQREEGAAARKTRARTPKLTSGRAERLKEYSETYRKAISEKEMSAKRRREQVEDYAEVFAEVETRAEALKEGLSPEQRASFESLWEKTTSAFMQNAEIENAKAGGKMLALELDTNLAQLEALVGRMEAVRAKGLGKPIALLEVYSEMGPAKIREGALLSEQRGGATTGQLTITNVEASPHAQPIIELCTKGEGVGKTLEGIVKGLDKETVSRELGITRERLLELVGQKKYGEVVAELNKVLRNVERVRDSASGREKLVGEGIILNIVDGQLVAGRVSQIIQRGRATALVVEPIEGMDPLNGQDAYFQRNTKSILLRKGTAEAEEATHEISHYDQHISGFWDAVGGLRNEAELEAAAKAIDLGFSKVSGRAIVEELLALESEGGAHGEGVARILDWKPPGAESYSLREVFEQAGIRQGDPVEVIETKLMNWARPRYPGRGGVAGLEYAVNDMVRLRLRQYVDARYEAALGVSRSDLFRPISATAPERVSWEAEGVVRTEKARGQEKEGEGVSAKARAERVDLRSQQRIAYMERVARLENEAQREALAKRRAESQMIAEMPLAREASTTEQAERDAGKLLRSAPKFKEAKYTAVTPGDKLFLPEGRVLRETAILQVRGYLGKLEKAAQTLEEGSPALAAIRRTAQQYSQFSAQLVAHQKESSPIISGESAKIFKSVERILHTSKFGERGVASVVPKGAKRELEGERSTVPREERIEAPAGRYTVPAEFRIKPQTEAVENIAEQASGKLSSQQLRYVQEQMGTEANRFSEMDRAIVAPAVARVVQVVPRLAGTHRIGPDGKMRIPLYYEKASGKLLGLGDKYAPANKAQAQRVDLVLDINRGKIVEVREPKNTAGSLKFWPVSRALSGLQVQEARPGYDAVAPRAIANMGSPRDRPLSVAEKEYVSRHFEGREVLAKDAQVLAKNTSSMFRMADQLSRVRPQQATDAVRLEGSYNMRTGEIVPPQTKSTPNNPIGAFTFTFNLSEGKISNIKSGKGKPSPAFMDRIKSLEGLQIRESISIEEARATAPSQPAIMLSAEEAAKLRAGIPKKGEGVAAKAAGERELERREGPSAEPQNLEQIREAQRIFERAGKRTVLRKGKAIEEYREAAELFEQNGEVGRAQECYENLERLHGKRARGLERQRKVYMEIADSLRATNPKRAAELDALAQRETIVPSVREAEAAPSPREKIRIPVVEKILPKRAEELAIRANEHVWEGRELPKNLSPREAAAFEKLLEGARKDKEADNRLSASGLLRTYAEERVVREFESEAEKDAYLATIREQHAFEGEMVDRYTNVEKAIVLGDPHAEFDATYDLLEKSGAVRIKAILPDASYVLFTPQARKGASRYEKLREHFEGKYEVTLKEGEHVALTGDYFDRGSAGLETFTFLRWLRTEAEAKGAHVHLLRGNHEEVLLGAYESHFKNKSTAQMDGLLREFDTFDSEVSQKQAHFRAEYDKTHADESASRRDARAYYRALDEVLFGPELTVLQKKYVGEGMKSYAARQRAMEELAPKSKYPITAEMFADKVLLGNLGIQETILELKSWYSKGEGDTTWWESAKADLEANGTIESLRSLKPVVVLDNYYITHAGPDARSTSLESQNQHYREFYSERNNYQRSNLRQPPRGNYDMSYLGRPGGWKGNESDIVSWRDSMARRLGIKPQDLTLVVGHSPQKAIAIENGVIGVDMSKSAAREALVLAPAKAEVEVTRGPARTLEGTPGLQNEHSAVERMPVLRETIAQEGVSAKARPRGTKRELEKPREPSAIAPEENLMGIRGPAIERSAERFGIGREREFVEKHLQSWMVGPLGQEMGAPTNLEVVTNNAMKILSAVPKASGSTMISGTYERGTGRILTLEGVEYATPTAGAEIGRVAFGIREGRISLVKGEGGHIKTMRGGFLEQRGPLPQDLKWMVGLELERSESKVIPADFSQIVGERAESYGLGSRAGNILEHFERVGEADYLIATRSQARVVADNAAKVLAAVPREGTVTIRGTYDVASGKIISLGKKDYLPPERMDVAEIEISVREGEIKSIREINDAWEVKVRSPEFIDSHGNPPLGLRWLAGLKVEGAKEKDVFATPVIGPPETAVQDFTPVVERDVEVLEAELPGKAERGIISEAQIVQRIESEFPGANYEKRLTLIEIAKEHPEASRKELELISEGVLSGEHNSIEEAYGEVIRQSIPKDPKDVRRFVARFEPGEETRFGDKTFSEAERDSRIIALIGTPETAGWGSGLWAISDKATTPQRRETMIADLREVVREKSRIAQVTKIKAERTAQEVRDTERKWVKKHGGTRLLKIYGNGGVEGQRRVLKDMGVEISGPRDLGQRLSKETSSKIFEIATQGGVMRAIRGIEGFRGFKLSGISFQSGLRGAYELTLTKGKETRKVFLKMEDLGPSAFGERLIEAEGMATAKIHHGFEYDTGIRYPNGKPVMQKFGLVENVYELAGQRIKLRLPTGKKDTGGKETTAIQEVEILEVGIVDNVLQAPDRSSPLHQQVYGKLATAEGRKEIFEAWNYYQELSRRILLQDRRPPNTIIMLVRRPGETEPVITFQPMDLNLMAHIGNERGVLDYSFFETQAFAATREFLVGLSNITSERIIMGTEISPGKRFGPQIPIDRVEMLEEYSAVAKPNYAPDSPKIQKAVERVISDHDAKPYGGGYDAVLGHHPLNPTIKLAQVGDVRTVAGVRTLVTRDDGAYRLDAGIFKSILENTEKYESDFWNIMDLKTHQEIDKIETQTAGSWMLEGSVHSGESR